MAIKSVNHRFFNASVRTPVGFDRLEHEFQRWLRPRIARGHVHVVVNFDRATAAGRASLPVLDIERARRYVELLRTLGSELELAGEPDVTSVARFGEIFRLGEALPEIEVEREVVRELIEEAVVAVVATREAEGRRLQADMSERVELLQELVTRVEHLAPQRLVRERDRLRMAVRELADQEDVDEERLAREIAYLSEKWDISEEIVRFGSHLQLFRESLTSEGPEPVGKKLSFVVQEMHREANTLGAKANDTEIAHIGVSMKEEIERLREQVENVE